jgi:hypothetical protein
MKQEVRGTDALQSYLQNTKRDEVCYNLRDYTFV